MNIHHNDRTAKDVRVGGFTLIELLAVIIIIVILVGIVMGFSGYAGRKSDVSRARADLEYIKNILEEYRVNRGSYPVTINGGVFTNGTFFASLTNGLPPSVTFDTNKCSRSDPWGNSYVYDRLTAYSYLLWSCGPDGTNGTSAVDLDNISNNRSN